MLKAGSYNMLKLHCHIILLRIFYHIKFLNSHNYTYVNLMCNYSEFYDPKLVF